MLAPRRKPKSLIARHPRSTVALHEAPERPGDHRSPKHRRSWGNRGRHSGGFRHRHRHRVDGHLSATRDHPIVITTSTQPSPTSLPGHNRGRGAEDEGGDHRPPHRPVVWSWIDAARAADTYRHRLCQRRHIGHGRDVVIVGERRGVWEWHPERQQLPTHLCHRKCHQLPGLRRRLGPRGGRVPGRARDATQWELDSAVELSTRFGLGSRVNVTHTPLRSSMKAL